MILPLLLTSAWVEAAELGTVVGLVFDASGAPVARSHSDRSMAQPRLCREPFAGSATKSRCAAGVASQNSLVTRHGR